MSDCLNLLSQQDEDAEDIEAKQDGKDQEDKSSAENTVISEDGRVIEI